MRKKSGQLQRHFIRASVVGLTPSILNHLAPLPFVVADESNGALPGHHLLPAEPALHRLAPQLRPVLGHHLREFFFSYRPIPWRDSISRPIPPFSSVAGGEDTTRPRRQVVFSSVVLLDQQLFFFIFLLFKRLLH
jgi:hypothetical protein